MRTFLHTLSAAVLLTALTACTTVTTTTTASRPATRAAVRVDVAADGRPSMDGDVVTIPALARRLKKRESVGRAVALHGATGCTQATLVHLQRELVRHGVPNVSIVTARRATAEVRDNAAGAPEAPASPPGP